MHEACFSGVRSVLNTAYVRLHRPLSHMHTSTYDKTDFLITLAVNGLRA